MPRIPPLNTDFVPNFMGAHQNALRAQSMGLQNKLMAGQVANQPRQMEMQEQEFELRKTALDLKKKALEQADKPGPITIGYPDFEVSGPANNIAIVAEALSKDPSLVKNPKFPAWIATEGISYKPKDKKAESASTTELGKLIAERNKYPEGSGPRKFYDDRIAKITQSEKTTKQREPLNFKDVVDLQAKFQKLPEVEEYVKITTQMKRAEKAIQEARAGRGSMNAVDQSLITLLNKILDPSSVVRESEYARTPEGMSVINRLEGYFGKLSKGGAGLSPSEREGLYTMINKFYKVSEDMYNNQVEYYKQLATKFGEDPKDVLRLGGKTQNLSTEKTAADMTDEELIEALEGKNAK
jgi:hypothetical protein